MSYRVCIPTAGIGSRLGVLTSYVNKSLVGVANRPILSHIIEQFPDTAEFVIALGHKGHLVREFLQLAYPKRRFYFCEVTPFEGPGSGLGLSLLACKEHLQQPFIFISCDTLVKGYIPAPNENWMAYADIANSPSYRMVEVTNGSVTAIHEKSESAAGLPYIGLAGIHDWQAFWNVMEHEKKTAISTGEAHGLRGLLAHGVKAHAFPWYDTGNPEALARTREAYRQADEPTILEKANEAIWFIGNKVIKFSDDEKFIANRVKRAQQLQGFVPSITASQPHMYRYDKVEGDVLSQIVTLPLLARLLEQCKIFWQRKALAPEEAKKFHAACKRFYHDKTLERVALFYKNFPQKDGAQPINEVAMPTLAALLEKIDWDWLADGLPGRFHGDFHNENILWNDAQQAFIFLDWRQDFGGDLAIGDVYYDLAKYLHGLIINHELIVKDFYNVKWSAERIDYDFERKEILVECEQYFIQWLAAEGYDVKKVWVLTALIYLNIAALHHHPYGLLLYALGKAMLQQQLER